LRHFENLRISAQRGWGFWFGFCLALKKAKAADESPPLWPFCCCDLGKTTDHSLNFSLNM
jgi:hypothetical protein